MRFVQKCGSDLVFLNSVICLLDVKIARPGFEVFLDFAADDKHTWCTRCISVRRRAGPITENSALSKYIRADCEKYNQKNLFSINECC